MFLISMFHLCFLNLKNSDQIPLANTLFSKLIVGLDFNSNCSRSRLLCNPVILIRLLVLSSRLEMPDRMVSGGRLLYSLKLERS